jgi:SAM-dependent methyltransferase
MHKAPGDLDHLRRLLGELHGLDVVDVGCGAGQFALQVVDEGGRVIGIEVTKAKVDEARRAGAGTEARFELGRGEELPLPDGSQDLVLYLRALHHVPVAAMDDALTEAHRVLRPGGWLYVVEPVAEGDFYALVCLVEDETEVRVAAQAALARAPGHGFALEVEEEYELPAIFRDLDDVRRRLVAVDPARAPVFEARREELQRRFQVGGEARGGMRWFAQPQRVSVLRASGVPHAIAGHS